MEWIQRFAVAILAIQYVEGVSPDDCWIPCNNFQHGSCVSIQCKTDSRATFECHLISTIMPSHLVKKPLRTCITPREVPGMAHFCSNILTNDTLLLENWQRVPEIKPTPKVASDNEDITVANGPVCVPVTIMAGVAVGCFTTGCVVTWLFLLVLWSRNAPSFCKETQKDEKLSESGNNQSASSVPRNEEAPPRLMSLSHQRLISSTSVDSGPSSTQAVGPVSPPGRSQAIDTCMNTETDTMNDYTRLNRESTLSVVSHELLPVIPYSDYASLVSSDVLSLANNVESPYLHVMQKKNVQQYHQSKNLHQGLASTSDACDYSTDYPSIARSTKSDKHDYDSIFSGVTTNAMNVDQRDDGNRGDSESEYHDYQECEAASGSLDRHGYLSLAESPHDYFILEKDSETALFHK